MTQRPVHLEVRILTDLREEQISSMMLWQRFFSRLGIGNSTYVESVKLRKPRPFPKTKEKL